MQVDPSVDGTTDRAELSYAEEQFWQAEQADARPVPFFDCTSSLSVVVRLEHALNHQALTASLDDIVRRHDVLRSRFVVRDGRPARLFHHPAAASLTTIDLRQGTCTDSPALVKDVVEEEVTRRFDLTRGPLFRALLVALADDEHILAITVHHIVFDRWSTRVLARELKLRYEAYATGQTPGIEPLRARYQDYVSWQRRRVDSDVGRELIAYWTAKLRDVGDGALSREVDGDREHAASTRAGSWCFTIPEQDASRLAAMSRRYRVTLAAVMLTLFTWVLHRTSGRDDIAVGVPLSDRRHPDVEPLIGLFANVVVVRTTITGRMTFLELLDRVRRALLEASRYQDLPYGRLVQVIGTQTPLYRAVFNFMPDIPESHLELAGLRVTPVDVSAEQRSLSDLSLRVRHDAGRLACRLVYKADLFSAAWVRDVAAQFHMLAAAVLDEPQKDVGLYD